jgi:Holliday junction resolvase RusA-like endonuclease
MLLTIDIDGDPKGQPRPRATTINGYTRMYEPKSIKPWKTAVTLAAKKAMRDQGQQKPIEEPIAVTMLFEMPRPKSHYGTGKNAHKVKQSAPIAHTSTPDLDNLEKAVLDALTRCNVWRDDSLITSIKACKLYGERGGCFVAYRIATLNPCHHISQPLKTPPIAAE